MVDISLLWVGQEVIARKFLELDIPDPDRVDTGVGSVPADPRILLDKVLRAT